MAHQEADHLLVAIAVLLGLVGAVGQDLVHDRLKGARVAHLTHAALIHDLGGVVAAFRHGLEHLVRLVARDGVLGEKLCQRRHLARGDAALGKAHTGALEIGRQLVDHEIRDRLGRLANKSRGRGLKEGRRLGIARKLLGVGALDTEVLLKARTLGVGQLGQLRAAMLDEIVG